MTESTSLSDRYLELIDRIVEMTLKGKVRSKEQVYQMLLREIDRGTGEIFERCLSDRLNRVGWQLKKETDELKQAKANRQLRALQTVEKEWERWQKENRVSAAIAAICDRLEAASPEDCLTVVLEAIDPNQAEILTLEQIREVAKTLMQKSEKIADEETRSQLQQIAAGLQSGLKSWSQIEPHLVSWIYDRGRGQLGFGGVPGQDGPWATWEKQVDSSLARDLFRHLSFDRPIADLVQGRDRVEISDFLQLVLILRDLQLGLVTWFDKMVYDSKIGAKLSIATYLTFATIWSQLGHGFQSQTTVSSTTRDRAVRACFQMTLQILRAFAGREYFPLYGGIFAAFSGDYLRGALQYLDAPLKHAEGTEEKARILTLLGYSMRTIGQYDRAIAFHRESLEIARSEGDRVCEIANLNHLSRTHVSRKEYGEAIAYSQQALVLARQGGDRLGEANALANLGFSEVFQARQREELNPDVYESAVNYLEQALQLLERLGDNFAANSALRQSQALCFSSLGIAYVTVDRHQEAIAHLERAWQSAQISGDLYLQGLTLSYLARAYYHQNDLPKTIFTGSLGMYLLEQIEAVEWRAIAGLLTVVQGQLSAEGFQETLQQLRSQFLPAIGVDGYDYIPELLQKYREFLE
ncbi:tetratricopeptide repeat protein [Oxynema aestuarii]|jgi:tetratricopeptide (TPR) repeat protein|uniref:Tetratricopeptide repeat protein n=1 Tax=Oxynema aestuarii AP17 TaxID=2064643 RepID=A0A6H1TV42_9CYAN|nr:tetratricopeptide repeat protein [Oxynema aestuarii]QIZ69189.1 tetratricopeptide repeat protein [Oxynema aestuarii AP17]RMH77353.1 MAG: tetratricopeptide repeat protein [Cyanobacteria bacterium J007]